MYKAAQGNSAITDESLKTWIANTLPSLKTHLGKAQGLQTHSNKRVRKPLPPMGAPSNKQQNK